MFIPVLIIGSGIARMSVALNLSKKNIDYLVITKASNYLKSNSILAPANMRYFDDYEKGINIYMEQCEGNYETINSIYSNQKYLLETLNELKIKFKKTPIGVMPINNENETAGAFLIKKLKNNVKNILTETYLVDIKIHENYVECLTFNKNKGFININCGVLVVSSGGFANLFKFNDNSCTATGEVTYLLHKYTNKLKGISTIMFHPFGVQEGKRMLTGDIVSQLENIYEKDINGNFVPLKIKEETLLAIKNNSYHNNKIFTNILRTIAEKEVYLKFEEGFNVKQKLLDLGYSLKIIVNNNMIKINPTAHYTSGGLLTNKSFQVTDRIFANGEVIFDGSKGIGRLPGHPFSSAIISSKIIADTIEKMQIEEFEKESKFDIIDKIKSFDEDVSNEYEKILRFYAKETASLLMLENIDKKKYLKIKEKLQNTLKEIEINIKSIKNLNIYYSMNLIYKIIEEKLEEIR